MKPNMVIFASGNGSNALNIIQHFEESKQANVAAVFTNNKNAGVISKAIENRIAVQYFNKADFYETGRVIDLVNQYRPTLIVLAGFLWLVPASFINAFNNQIINLHPALLPKYGGKGMYGANVHKAVLEAGEKESGITIHAVNDEFDKGEILFQARCSLTQNETLESLTAKIHELEHAYLPKVISELLPK